MLLESLERYLSSLASESRQWYVISADGPGHMSDSVKVYPNKERIAPGEHASPGMLRSCPPGLQGTLMMLIASAQMFALRASDVLGSWIY